MEDAQKWIAEQAADPRSNDEIIEALHGECEDEDYLQMLTVLQARRDPNIIRRAQVMCASTEPLDRVIGVQILAQVGARDCKILEEDCIETILGLVAGDAEPEVLGAAGYALQGYSDPRIAPSLAGLRHHADSEVRYAVVHGLLARVDAAAVEALIELSADPDDDLRNWATFGLARQIDLDTSPIREALMRCLEDENEEVRGEALIGLARRHDERVFEPLRQELQAIASADQFCDLAFEAAMEIGDRRLHLELAALKADGIENEWLDGAIKACGG